MKSYKSTAVIFACLAVNATIAMAVEPDATTEPAVKPVTFTLSGSASYAFDTDLHDSGSMSLFRSGGSISMDDPISKGDDLRLTFSGEYNHYFFRNLSAVPGDDGSDSLDAYQFDIRPPISHYFNENFGVFGGVNVTAAGMAEAKFGDSVTYGVFAGVNYQIAPKVWIGGGFGVQTELEDNPLVVPLIVVDWAVTPDLTLSADGLGLKATYKLDTAWSIFAKVRYDYRQFRLDSHEVLSNGVLTDQSVPITLGVTWAPDDALSFTGEVGMVAWRRIDFTESNGHDFRTDETDPSAFVSVQVSYSF